MFSAPDYWEKISRHMDVDGWLTIGQICSRAHLSAGTAGWALEYAKRHDLVEVAIERVSGGTTIQLYRKRIHAMAASQ